MLVSPEGALLGKLPPVLTDVPWWPEVASVVRAVRRDHGVAVTVLRLLRAERDTQPGGRVTYLAEVEAPVGCEPCDEVLDEHPLRCAYARPGGPGRDLAWATSRLTAQGLAPAGAAEQIKTWNLSSVWRIPLCTGQAWLKVVPEFFARLSECGLPDGLVHGDFHSGNVRIAENQLTLLDWGDAGIGHPLLDQAAFLERVPEEQRGPLRAHFQAAWQRAVPCCDPARAAALIEPIAAARQAILYDQFLDQIEPSEHPYHRGDSVPWLLRAARACLRSQSPSASRIVCP